MGDLGRVWVCFPERKSPPPPHPPLLPVLPRGPTTVPPPSAPTPRPRRPACSTGAASRAGSVGRPWAPGRRRATRALARCRARAATNGTGTMRTVWRRLGWSEHLEAGARGGRGVSGGRTRYPAHPADRARPSARRAVGEGASRERSAEDSANAAARPARRPSTCSTTTTPRTTPKASSARTPREVGAAHAPRSERAGWEWGGAGEKGDATGEAKEGGTRSPRWLALARPRCHTDSWRWG